MSDALPPDAIRERLVVPLDPTPRARTRVDDRAASAGVRHAGPEAAVSGAGS